MNRLLLLINPSSRSGAEGYEEIYKKLTDRGHIVIGSEEELKKASFPDIILKYKDEIDVVIVGGGDGSVNSVLDSLVKIQKPLLVIPLGTANNMARTLNIPKNLDENLDLLKNLKVTKIDLGVVNDIYFVNVAGLGLSARINESAKSEHKKMFGVFAFIFTAISKIKSMKPFSVSIHHDDKVHHAKSWQVSICNGRHYGSGLVVSDEATLNDGKLHCLSTEVKKWWEVFYLIPSVMKGKYGPNEDATLLEGLKMEIKTKRPMKIDIDGDIKTQTPAKFHVERKILPVLIP